MAFECLKLECRDGVALLTIHRPDKLNALNAQTFAELHQAMDRIEGDTTVRAVILTGAGEKAFVAGADIQELAKMNALTGKQVSETGQRLMNRIEYCTRPVIAAVNGFALGGGCELALCCHIRLASANAQFGLPEVGLGIIPGYAATQRLARIVGRGRAMELVLTGDRIKADDARAMGLVSQVFPAENFVAQVDEYARKKLLTKSLVAQSFAIQAVNRAFDMSCEAGQHLEATMFGLLSATEDMHEGMNAFLEKRAPNFKHTL